MGILVIENNEEEYNDIKKALDSHQHEHFKHIEDIDETSTEYKLIISDILRGVSQEEKSDPNVWENIYSQFCKCMEEIAELHKKFGGNLIMITKIPVNKLIYYLKKSKNESQMLSLFSKNYDELMEQLNKNKNGSNFFLYKYDNVVLLTKPYKKLLVLSKNKDESEDTLEWKNNLNKLIKIMIQ